MLAQSLPKGMLNPDVVYVCRTKFSLSDKYVFQTNNPGIFINETLEQETDAGGCLPLHLSAALNACHGSRARPLPPRSCWLPTPQPPVTVSTLHA